MQKLPNPQLRPVIDNKKLRDALRPGTKLPHIGAQQRMMQQLKAAGQWFWMVQEVVSVHEIGKLIDTGVVVVTSEKYKHEFTRRMSKKEVFEYVRKVAISQREVASPSVNQPVNGEVKK